MKFGDVILYAMEDEYDTMAVVIDTLDDGWFIAIDENGIIVEIKECYISTGEHKTHKQVCEYINAFESIQEGTEL